MTGTLVSLNISPVKSMSYRGKPVPTGIFKTPVEGSLNLFRETLYGDHQVDRRFHGGADKAVYCYPHEHYAFWEASLGRSDLRPGHFGENFTVQGLLEPEVCIGDRFRVGEAEVEVTQPRVPCYKLGVRMGNQAFPKAFLASGRVGFYLRVLTEGLVQAGAPMVRYARGAAGLSISEAIRLHFFDTDDVNGIRHALSETALSRAWQDELRALLRQDTGKS